uniref:L1 transposable element RRM domain-containing protein n=1 Tax=Sinocyclocheilus anshuiensis TaxID=1608454 RepID=A0A671QM50_9TELE
MQIIWKHFTMRFKCMNVQMRLTLTYINKCYKKYYLLFVHFSLKLSNISTRSSPKMADALMNPIDMDALVKKITTEVLVGVEKALENKIDPVLEKLSAVATHVEQVENRVTEAETRISAVEDTVSRDNADLNEVKKKLDAALEKIDDLENRSRRCNIRIIGLPEGEEGTNPVSFLRTWLPNLLNTDFKNHQVKIERAHRVPSRLPTSGERPRALMVKLHNFQDKARILQAARTASQLVYKRIRFAMIYPATLRIGLQHNGSEKFFKQPAEAESFLDGLPEPSTTTSPGTNRP